MKQLGFLLLGLIAACHDFSGFNNAQFADSQLIEPVGEAHGAYFSSLARAFAFTLTDEFGTDHVFVHSLSTGRSEEAGVVPLAGGVGVLAADGDSTGGTTDATGRMVAFLSDATNLVEPPTLGTMQLYARDLDGGIELVSQDAFGDEADASILSAQLSGNGRFLVLATAATNLHPDANGFAQVYVFDLFTGRLELVSRNLAVDDLPGNGDCTLPTITPDGRFIAFESAATNFDPADVNGIDDIYLVDRSAQTVERISGAPGGTPGGMRPALSQNGNFVVYEALDAGAIRQVFCVDRAAATPAQLTFGDADSRNASISADGRFTTFQSDATDLIAGDTNELADIYVCDITTTTTARVSVATDGTEGDGDSLRPTISSDGRLIAFESTAYAITGRDPSGLADIFVFNNPLLP